MYNIQYLLVWYLITLGRVGSAPSSPSLNLESTGSTPSLESVSRYSLSTMIFAFFDALPSLVDTVQGLWLSVPRSWLCLLRRVWLVLIGPHDEFNSNSSVYNPHIRVLVYTWTLYTCTIPGIVYVRIRMYARYHMHMYDMIPDSWYRCSYDVLRNRSWLSSARYKQLYNLSGVTVWILRTATKKKRKTCALFYTGFAPLSVPAIGFFR